MYWESIAEFDQFQIGTDILYLSSSLSIVDIREEREREIGENKKDPRFISSFTNLVRVTFDDLYQLPLLLQPTIVFICWTIYYFLFNYFDSSKRFAYSWFSLN